MVLQGYLRSEKLDRAVLQNALAKYSSNSVSTMKQMLAGQKQHQPSGAFKRAAREALAPYRPCFMEIKIPSKNKDEEAPFAACHLPLSKSCNGIGC